MIKNNISYGNIIVPTFAEFGKGDIAVMHGLNDDHVALILKNTRSFEIGSTNTFQQGDSSDNIFPEIVMVFDKIESIDVMIEQLELAKIRLNEII